MHVRSIFPVLMLIVSAGCCSPCPSYGPGLSRNPYGSCIGNDRIASPVPLGGHRMNHRPTLAERKQQRDMKRWYRELDGGSGPGDHCPHCQRRNRDRRGSGYDSGYYDEWGYDESAYYDGMIMDGGYYDGQIIDGGMYDGSFSGGYCSDCQNSHQQNYPPVTEPYTVEPSATPGKAPMVPPTEPTPATSDDSSALRVPINEFYSPSTTPQLPVQQVSIPPVEQILYAPPIQK